MLLIVLVSLSVVIVGSLLLIQMRGLNPLVSTMKSAPLSAGTVTEYKISTTFNSEPVGITSGPDGNLWFTESHGNNIGTITTSGQMKEYALPNAKSEPEGITSGPDGNVWFTEFSSLSGNRIGKITTSGQITEYALPNGDSEPEAITTGPDGNLWFTEFDGNRIGTITTSGQITEYTLPDANSEPEAITSGPCGDNMQATCLWFTEFALNATGNTAYIGRITTSGTITQYALPTKYARANGITLGPNGTLYFTEQVNSSGDLQTSEQALIGEITTSGSVQLSVLASLPNGASLPNSIVQGSDGNLWFTEYYQIGQITPSGTLHEYPIPNSSSLPDVITAGPDGNLWFTEYTRNAIARISVS
jgi:streptogramin lyase